MFAKLSGYKTVIFFVLVLLVEIANLLGFGSFQMSAQQQDILSVIIPVIGLVLRMVTKSPIFAAPPLPKSKKVK